MSDVPKVIQSQYLAALAMLKQAVENCPDDLWNRESPNRFWHTAYHALFYTHLYVQPTHDDFTPWNQHRDEARSLHDQDPENPAEPYTRAEVLNYLAFCEGEIKRIVPTLDLDAASGFEWLPFNKLETQFYSIRHIMQHTGELYQQLLEEKIELRWVGRVEIE